MNEQKEYFFMRAFELMASGLINESNCIELAKHNTMRIYGFCELEQFESELVDKIKTWWSR